MYEISFPRALLLISNCCSTRRVIRLAGRLPAASSPMTRHSTVLPMWCTDRSAAFRDCGIEQVGSDRCRRVNTEQQDKERSHERSATDAGHANDGPDRKARKDIGY